MDLAPVAILTHCRDQKGHSQAARVRGFLEMA